MEQAVTGKLFGFGVWRAPVLIDGFPAIWAVDQYGVVRKVRTIKPGDDVEELGDRMWTWLRTHHPVRKVELVREPRPAPPAPETPPGLKLVRVGNRMVDERLLKDPRSPLARRAYLDRLVKDATRRSGILRFRSED
jgi:hypothetical protein